MLQIIKIRKPGFVPLYVISLSVSGYSRQRTLKQMICYVSALYVPSVWLTSLKSVFKFSNDLPT